VISSSPVSASALLKKLSWKLVCARKDPLRLNGGDWGNGYSLGWHAAIFSFVRDLLRYDCTASQRRLFGAQCRHDIAYWHSLKDKVAPLRHAVSIPRTGDTLPLANLGRL